MKKHIKRIVSIVLLLFFSACATKKYAKLGLKSEQSGLYEDAAEYYLKSVIANTNNIESKIGAKKNGQISLDKKLADFSKAYISGNAKNAVYYYLNAKEFQERFQQHGIELDLPPSYEEQFNESKKAHIDEKYRVGVKLLSEEKFYDSEVVFNEILKLEPGYKDVSELRLKAHYEPKYRRATNYLENKQFRKAYYTFDTIVSEIKSYKEAVQYKEDAFVAATFSVWIKDFTCSADPTFASTIRNSVISHINNSGNIFLKIIDKANSQEYINEQALSLSGSIAENAGTQAGKLLGAKAILTAQLVNLKIKNGDLNGYTEKGYLKKVKYTTNAQTGQPVEQVEYKKIKYDVYSQANTVSCTFKYELVSTETGVILLADEFDVTKTDAINYAVYQGDYKHVVPGFWKWELLNSTEDIVKTNYSDVSALQKLFNGYRTIKSTTTLKNELINDIAVKTSTYIANFNPEK